MKKMLIALSAFVVVLSSCQKEASYDLGNSGSTGSSLLVKVVSKQGSDSTEIDFGYNSSKKLISMTTSGLSSGNVTDVRDRYVRNGSGIITQIITKSSSLTPYGIDSILANVHYDAANARYTSRVVIYNFFGATALDSLALIYDVNGKVIGDKDYFDATGGGYVLNIQDDYTYSGSNLASIKMSSYDVTTASLSVLETITYDAYDAKTSPLILGNEAFILGYSNWYSSNNGIKGTITVPSNPAQNQNYSVAYTYNSTNKPVTATQTSQTGTISATYYYQ